MDHKTFSFNMTGLDAEGRTLEGYANVFNVKDSVGDIVHPGAFAKTIVERGNKVKLLWQHDPSEVIGRPVELREDTNGLFIKAVVSDTQRGRDALALLQDNAIGEMSIGYDVVKGMSDFTKDPLSGETVRNLREIKLWEVSLVTFPANEYAVVTALKEDPAPTEDKAPMKTEADGEHPASHYLVVEDAEKPSTWHLRVRGTDGKPDHRLMGAAWAALHGGYRGNRYEGPGKGEALAKLKRLYESEALDTPKEGEDPDEEKAGRRLRGDKVSLVRQLREIADQLSKWADYEDQEQEEQAEPSEDDACNPDDERRRHKDTAEPLDIPALTEPLDLLTLIEIEEQQLSMIN